MKNAMEEFLDKQINNYKTLYQPDESEWIEDAIHNEHIKYYEYKQFSDIRKIGFGAFGKVYRAKLNRKNFALKAFEYENKEEIINEVNIIE